MKIKRVICLILSALFLLPLSACKPSGTAVDTTTAAEVEAEPLVLAENGATDYVIIIPETASDALVASCRELVNAFSNCFGATISFKRDPISKDGSFPENEILIGDTNRPESAQLKQSLSMKDFAICAVGSKIVINGGNETAICNAVSKFISTTVYTQRGASRALYTEENNETFVYEYKITSCTIGGTDIGEFSIVIPKNSSVSEYRTAVLLRAHIGTTVGAAAEIITDDAADGTAEIRIGRVAGSTLSVDGGEYAIKATGNCLDISAGSYYAYAALIDYLTETVFDKKNKTCEIADGYSYSENADSLLKDGSENILSRQGDLRVMFNNILGNCDASIYPREERVRMICELYSEYLPDVLCLQECNSACRTGTYNIEKLLAELGYAEVKSGASGNNFTPVFYLTAKFNVVECGFHRYDDGFNDNSKSYTWAVLELKDGGKRFGVVSTHFCYKGVNDLAEGTNINGEAARITDALELIECVDRIVTKYSVPVIMGGDLNCTVSSSAVAKLVNAGYINAQAAAAVSEDVKTVHGYPALDPDLGIYTQITRPSGGYSGAIDHIYISGDLDIRLYDSVTDDYALLSTDHLPMYIDFNLK